MDIKIFKWILNLLIIPFMTICLSMIIDGNIIIGIILFIELIFMSAIINSNDKHN
mgnify:CR=1 FL=1